MRITPLETPFMSIRTGWKRVTKQSSYLSYSSCNWNYNPLIFICAHISKGSLAVASVFIPLKVLFAAPYYYGSDVDLFIFANRK